MSYHPDPASAYESIRYITDDQTMGWLVRGMHKWGSSVMVILLFLHMARVYVFGAYKYPRELTWITGGILFIMVMAMSFTGYLLVWDQRAYWATVVGVNINGTGPIVGPYLANFFKAGPVFGEQTLARFYSLHMLVDPGRDLHVHLHPHVARRPPRRDVAALVADQRSALARHAKE